MFEVGEGNKRMWCVYSEVCPFKLIRAQSKFAYSAPLLSLALAKDNWKDVALDYRLCGFILLVGSG